MNRALQQLALRAYGIASRIVPLHRQPFATLYSRAYFAYKRFAEDSLAALARTHPELLRGGNIIDAGANIGYTALLFAHYVEPGFSVHAFEPDPRNASMLRRNVRNAHNVVVHEYALGAQHGRAQLWLNPGSNADHRIVTGTFAPGGRTIEVEVVRAEEVVPPPVCFVKIDVQGYELEVSRGLTTLLEINRRIAVVFEYAPAMMREMGLDPHELLDFYTSRGFALSPLGSGEYFDMLAVR
jgi:FkbM family methyltransferase